MGPKISYEVQFTIEGGDFSKAGSVSSNVKRILKEIGIPPDKIKRAVIISYEAEVNVVSYAYRGRFNLSITPELIHIVVDDEGPGIEDIELAMQEGYSTANERIREMGFGAGMGLPNIKKNSDRLDIQSWVGKGTRVSAEVFL
jgi:anti-sigma regulatory factor (Ser/Thr protein kinase)